MHNEIVEPKKDQMNSHTVFPDSTSVLYKTILLAKIHTYKLNLPVSFGLCVSIWHSKALLNTAQQSIVLRLSWCVFDPCSPFMSHFCGPSLHIQIKSMCGWACWNISIGTRSFCWQVMTKIVAWSLQSSLVWLQKITSR